MREITYSEALMEAFQQGGNCDLRCFHPSLSGLHEEALLCKVLFGLVVWYFSKLASLY